MTNITSIASCDTQNVQFDAHPQEISLEKVKGLTPDVHLLVGRHLDLPVALGLVGVVLGVVGRLEGYLSMKHVIFVCQSLKFETSCPSARLAFPFLHFKASTSFLARKVFFASHAFAAFKQIHKND